MIVAHLEENIILIINDPMILFYCVYYAVFYNNQEMLSKIRDIISYFKLSNRRWKIKYKFDFVVPNNLNINDLRVKFDK